MEIVDLLVQAPIVGIVIWYVWHTNKANREERKELSDSFLRYLEQRNSKMEKAMNEVSANLNDLHKQQEKHTNVLIKHFTKNHDGENTKNLMDNG